MERDKTSAWTLVSEADLRVDERSRYRDLLELFSESVDFKEY